MENKKIIIIIIVVILIALGLYAYLSSDVHSVDTIKISKTEFNIPDKYHSVRSGNNVNITNGQNSICLTTREDTDLMNHINYYVNVKKSENETINITDFEVNGITVYKSNLNNKENVHYWFIKNNELYEFYTWDANPNIDDVIKEILK